MTARLRAVIFDFGNTLAVPEDSLSLCRATLSEMGVAVSEERLAAALAEEAIARRTAGTVLETDWVACRGFHLQRSAALLAALGVGGRLAAKAVWLNQLYQARSLKRTPHVGCRECLSALAGMGLRMIVVSNSDGLVAGRCAAMGIADEFEAILDSALLGVTKPDPQIFRLALEQLRLSADEVVSVGDNWTNDVLCPKSLELRGVYCNAAVPAPEPAAADAVIATLHELPDVLRAWL